MRPFCSVFTHDLLAFGEMPALPLVAVAAGAIYCECRPLRFVRNVTQGEMEVGDDGLVRKEIYFRGRVQGVGFRQTTLDIASRFDVAGTVENLPDGQVLLVVEGRAAEVRSFVAAIESQMGRFIAGVDVQESPPTGTLAEFRIRY